LVTGALLCFVFAFDAAVDVGALFVESGEDAAGVSVKFEFAAVIAYVVDNATGNVLQVYVSLAFDFAGEYDLSGGDESFASDFRLRVAGEEFVEDCVRDLVSDFVGVTFRD
jgi:hypothetical protein